MLNKNYIKHFAIVNFFCEHLQLSNSTGAFVLEETISIKQSKNCNGPGERTTLIYRHGTTGQWGAQLLLYGPQNAQLGTEVARG